MNTFKIILIVAGLVAGLGMGIWGGFGFLEPIIGLATLAAASAAWLEQRRERRLASETVTVSLAIGEEGQVVLPLEIVRRDLSRAELLGRIGMLPMRQAGARFALRQLGTPAVMRELNRVLAGETSSLVIPASREEVDQFDL